MKRKNRETEAYFVRRPMQLALAGGAEKIAEVGLLRSPGCPTVGSTNALCFITNFDE